MASEYVYAAQNEAMPGLLKIGRTTRPLRQRLVELSGSTSVPFPFTYAYAVAVANCIQVEAIIRQRFDDHRVSAKREFFRVTVADLKAALAPYALRDATRDADEGNDVLQLDDAAMCCSHFYGDAIMGGMVATLAIGGTPVYPAPVSKPRLMPRHKRHPRLAPAPRAPAWDWRGACRVLWSWVRVPLEAAEGLFAKIPSPVFASAMTAAFIAIFCGLWQMVAEYFERHHLVMNGVMPPPYQEGKYWPMMATLYAAGLIAYLRIRGTDRMVALGLRPAPGPWDL